MPSWGGLEGGGQWVREVLPLRSAPGRPQSTAQTVQYTQASQGAWRNSGWVCIMYQHSIKSFCFGNSNFLPVPIWKYADWNNTEAAHLHNLYRTAQSCWFRNLQIQKYQVHQWTDTERRCGSVVKQPVIVTSQHKKRCGFAKRFLIFNGFVYCENKDN